MQSQAHNHAQQQAAAQQRQMLEFWHEQTSLIDQVDPGTDTRCILLVYVL
jgi:hypothetical protein